MKKLAIISAMALVFASAAPAYANSTTVINSGTDAKVYSTEVSTTDVNVTNNNTANISQTLMSSSNTGDNTTSGNINIDPCNPCAPAGTGSSIVTGNATTSNNMGVTANSNVTAVEVAPQGTGTNQTDVVNTGSNLYVNTSATTTTDVDVVNNNTATVDQFAFIKNNTGKNTSEDNIGSSNIVTGNAATGNVMGVNVNENATAVSITGLPYQQPTGGCFECVPCTSANCTSVVNSGTGAIVYSTAVNTTEVDVRNTNRLTADQMLFAMNNSGYNTAANNVYGSDIVTGSASTGNNMGVTGNSNLTAVSLGGSMPMGVNDLLVVNSGANAQLNATGVASTVLGTVNTNYLTTHQGVFNMSSSGSNTAYYNIGGGLTWTGGTGTSSTVAAGGNSNATAIGSGATSLMTLLALMSL